MRGAQTMSHAALLADMQREVARWTLNRPEKRNARAHALREELEVAVQRLETAMSVRVVVLAAAGPVFCSGHDLAEMTGRTEGEYRDLFHRCSRMMLRLRQL